MVKHKRIYLRFFDYQPGDWIPCECGCGQEATDIHHIHKRSLGGGDNIENLAALSRGCHYKADNDPEFNARIRQIHTRKVTGWRNCTGK